MIRGDAAVVECQEIGDDTSIARCRDAGGARYDCSAWSDRRDLCWYDDDPTIDDDNKRFRSIVRSGERLRQLQHHLPRRKGRHLPIRDRSPDRRSNPPALSTANLFLPVRLT